MPYLKFLFLFFFVYIQLDVSGCTIVAVSGRATIDGRPLLLKNRDSGTWDIQIKSGQGSKYMYLCQCKVPDGSAYSGYNEAGFSIINSNSLNLASSDYKKNAYIMQLALEHCATIDEFESLLDSLQKPMSVRSNYGVMDAKGHVAIFEVGAYNYSRFDADETENGYLIRSNFSFSPISSEVDLPSQYSYNRYKIASTYLEKLYRVNGFIAKEDLLHLTRYLVNSMEENLCDIAPFDENVCTPINFSDNDYIPRYASTSMMVIQGVLPNESPDMTVAWTMLGPPLTSVTVPYLITPQRFLPQKAKVGEDGHSWFCYRGQQLKDFCFQNDTTLNMGMLYNLEGTGIMQKICCIEEEILFRGNNLVDGLRSGGASYSDVETYYAWVDGYVEGQHEQNGLTETGLITPIEDIAHDDSEMEYYDLSGRRVRNPMENAIIKKRGKIAVVIR